MNMPTITDWLMVGITAVYVVATIAIWIANNKSAKASREQLEETKRQYEDKKRLEIMPYIQFEKSSGLGNYTLNLSLDSSKNSSESYNWILRMKNIGNGTAKDIKYTYEWDDGKEEYDRSTFPVQALSAEENQSIRIYISCASDGKDKSANLTFRYNDLLNHPYTQELSIKFKRTQQSHLKLAELSTSAPKLSKCLCSMIRV